MRTTNISLPGAFKDFVDTQVGARGFGTSCEYVRELIRRDQDRVRLRELLLAGAASQPGERVTSGYFEALRARAGGAGKVRRACS